MVIMITWIVTLTRHYHLQGSPYRLRCVVFVGAFLCEGGSSAMLVVKKINNNVAVCEDGNHRQLIAFGVGIGFPPTPYELTDLSKIERTFYNVDTSYIPLLSELSPDIIRFTARQLTDMQDELAYEMNSNLILTLADHLSFAIERVKRNIYVQFPTVYELEINYPAEINIGKKMVEAVKRELGVALPKGEVQGIAMHLINARDKALDEEQEDLEQSFDEILEETTKIIEEEMGVTVWRDTFNYARFATHVQYLLKRAFQQKHIDSENLVMYRSMQEEYPKISACVDKISDRYRDRWGIELEEEEKLYLILHVNRVCSKEAI